MKEQELMFNDTWTIEPNEEEFFDTAEKILRLTDDLAEEIVLESIGEQLDHGIDTLVERINYVSLFREKYGMITPDLPYYDEEYLKISLGKVGRLLSTGIKSKYGVELGEDLDYSTPAQYLDDMETLYEFLFIRHYENLVSYFKNRLMKNKVDFVRSYEKLMSEDEHSKDLFVIQSKKKFKNFEDVIIMHFIAEIITDIKDMTTSGYDLFQEITDLDLYEEYNNRMSELLINYGNKIVINNDELAAELYLKPLEDRTIFSELRNTLLLSYLEECELEG